MVRGGARLVAPGAVLAVVAVVAALAGCSASGASASRASGVGSSAGGAEATGSAAARAGQSAGSGRSTRTNSRQAMPVVTPAAVRGVSYAAPSDTARARFAPALKASAGLLSSSSVRTLRVSGRDVGGVAVYGTKPGLAKSRTFQDQYVVQLINSIARQRSSPRFIRANGQVMALSTGPPAVAGWFEGDHVVLVYRQGRTPDLAGLALGVRQTPRGR